MNRALPEETLAALRRFSTPTVCNAIETFDVRPRTEGFMDRTIACRFPDLGPMVGYAVTAKIRASSPAKDDVHHTRIWAEFAKTPKPWVIVIEDMDWPDPTGSYWGEVNASTYSALGAIGVVTNGGVRDLAEVRPIGFHFFSSCLLVSHAYVHVVEVGTPVTVGGLTVHPGDLLHGDEHGVTSVPVDIAERLPDACRAIEAAERKLIGYAQSGNVDVEKLARLYGEVD
ncbi:MAG TPA: RraA family protein [Dehalococcoidia bacterium]|jgi:regulator of RNase E activity RraA|nr:RraA family protein [Dehalococcoidia bacterium]